MFFLTINKGDFDMAKKQKIVLLTITQEMIKKCPFPEQRCLGCLSQACKPDPMEGVDLGQFEGEDND
jgi:hypothetical protein